MATKRDLIMVLWNEFAPDTNDVADMFHVSTRDAYIALKDLEYSGLVVSVLINGIQFNNCKDQAKANPGHALTWQLYRTSDEGDEALQEILVEAARRIDLDESIFNKGKGEKTT